MKTFDMTRCKCTACDAPMDRATDVGLGDDTQPEPGDSSLCFYCGHIMVFADDLSVRDPTADEMLQIAGNPDILAAQKYRQLSAIPPRLRHRPRDARDYVIPFAQFIKADGSPDFTTMDHHKVSKCLRFRVCGICGEQMGRHIYFVGGPLCVVNRLFYDPPMHRECAIYCLKTCPHLARSKGRYRALPTQSPEGVTVNVGKMVTDVKAEYFALMHATKFDFGKTADGMLMAKAAPWVDVEYWKDGKPVGPVPPLAG